MVLVHEKIKQAIDIMKEVDIDCWVTFVRETVEHNDSAMHFIAGHGVVWSAAFILTKQGQKIALLGKGDHSNFANLGVYDQVITYVQGIKEPFRELLLQINPRQIALNYAVDNTSADGITHGMFLMLCDILDGTDLARRFVSADPIISRLRGRKTPEELRRIRQAAEDTIELFDILTANIQKGWTARTVSEFMHQQMKARDYDSSWSWDGDPGVTTGPDMTEGHGMPAPVEIQPGHALRLDFGIKKDGYCSDLQRTWYVLRDGENEAPTEVQKAFEVVQEGIRRAAKALRPGAIGWEIDALVRSLLAERGYPEFTHALGHQVGIWAHDGGSVLGPRWERYGQRCYQPLELNQVFTLEFGIQTSHGYVAQEEMAVVTETGGKLLATPQDRIWLLRL